MRNRRSFRSITLPVFSKLYIVSIRTILQKNLQKNIRGHISCQLKWSNKQNQGIPIALVSGSSTLTQRASFLRKTFSLEVGWTPSSFGSSTLELWGVSSFSSSPYNVFAMYLSHWSAKLNYLLTKKGKRGCSQKSKSTVIIKRTF